MKFDMGSTTLSTLVRNTEGSHQDLGGLVRRFVASVEPLEGKFNGQGRAAFDAFKSRTDEVADDLNNSLARILGGQSGMDTAFQTGDVETADNASRTQSSANFDAARFSSAR